jgi:hypothetical protein
MCRQKSGCPEPGLVLGIEVGPGESDLISEGEPENLTLHANEDDSDPDKRVYSFGLEKSSNQPREPGPIILLKQYQTTYVTVKNHMSIPTSVHWHGLELDSWSDGVPGWSASDGLESPVIEPGDQFTYKLSLMRPGTNTDHIVCEAAVVQWTIIFRVRISF